MDPEYPQTLLQVYDPPVLRYVRGDVQVLKHPEHQYRWNAESDLI